ncbi:hypothetical protein Naga_100006g1 [Nannochloropsis gaditana]|uniref:Uncharacterized protein n=1 Tax=Nannochloropsis gaditana TaxID=72520 RepID=W7U174_9STRA|nr:hypothetical protein Naga_100006g1 [Nannochloropsis gaditana]
MPHGSLGSPSAHSQADLEAGGISPRAYRDGRAAEEQQGTVDGPGRETDRGTDAHRKNGQAREERSPHLDRAVAKTFVGVGESSGGRERGAFPLPRDALPGHDGGGGGRLDPTPGGPTAGEGTEEERGVGAVPRQPWGAGRRPKKKGAVTPAAAGLGDKRSTSWDPAGRKGF